MGALYMFEPENELEHALVTAGADVGSRRGFLRQLLDADVFVALSADKIETNPDGTATIPVGAQLRERVVTRNGVTYMAFFSAASRARTIFKDTHVVAPDTTRAVFERHRGAAFVLNPGSEYSREFPPAEAERLLAGDFTPNVDPVTVTAPTSVLLSQPLPYPSELTGALSRAFADHPSIEAAYLTQVDYPGNPERRRAIGIELLNSDWRDFIDEVQGKLGDAIPDLRLVDFYPCPGGPFDGYFEKIEPFYRRTEPAKGWRQWFSRGG
jgi:hypothetical protein